MNLSLKIPAYWRRYQTDILALLLFAALTAVAAWPIITHLDQVIVGQDSDVPINLWADWWTLKALTDPSISFWQTDYLYYPQGTSLAFHSFSHLTTAVSLGLRPFFGILPAYNLAILLQYVLSGLAMFQLARYLTGSTTAALLAGIVFAFNSHNQYQSAHPVLLAVWCFPWTTLYLMRAVRENSRRYAAVAALFIFLTAAASTLLLIMMLLWLPILLLYLTLSTDWPRPQRRVLLTFGILSTIAAAPFVAPLLSAFLLQGDGSFFIAKDDLVIIGDMAMPLIPHWKLWLFQSIYIGFIPLILLPIARHRGRVTWPWYALLVGAYLFSIGPYPLLLGYKLDITLPWSIPIMWILRNPYRMYIFFSLALAMLVGHGYLVVAENSLKRPPLKLLAGLLFAILIFGEYTAPAFPAMQISVSTFYTDFLANAPNDTVLAMLPTHRNAGKMHMYYQIYHGRPMTGGTVSRGSADAFAFIEANPILHATATMTTAYPPPDEIDDALASLSEAQVDYLVLNKPLMTESEQAHWRSIIPFQPVFEDELVTVYDTHTQLGQK